jgi:hypothetical protein
MTKLKMDKVLKFEMAEHMFGDMDVVALVQQFRSQVVKCPPGAAKHADLLTRKTAKALPIGYHKG